MFADILKVPYNEIAKYVSIHYSNVGPFTDYIPIYEDTMVPYIDGRVEMTSEPEVIKKSLHTSFNLRGNFATIKSKRRIIAGYASVAVVDSDKHYIAPKTLQKGLSTLIEDPHYANLMLKHSNIKIGKILNSYGKYKTHVDDKGLFIVAEIRKDLKTADKIWKQILDGKLKGFSISGEIVSSHFECDENIFTDKMPHNFMYTGFLHLMLPNAAIIYAKRHPVEICLSAYRLNFAAGHYWSDDLQTMGRYFRLHKELMDYWKEVLPKGTILEVRYEDMVTDLERESKRIAKHIGVEWTPECLEFHRSERAVTTASATQVRKPIYKTSIGRWKKYEKFLEPLIKILEPIL